MLCNRHVLLQLECAFDRAVVLLDLLDQSVDSILYDGAVLSVVCWGKRLCILGVYASHHPFLISFGGNVAEAISLS